MKFITVILCAVLVFSLAGCGNSSNGVNNSPENSDGAPENSIKGKFVGRWEQSYLNNSDDESFEQYDAVTLNYPNRYIELYSNGKGVTNYFVGDYCNGDGVAFEWDIAYDDFYDKELLFIYYAVEEDECDEFGFKTNETSSYDLSFKSAKIMGEEIELDTPVEKYETPVETTSFRFFEQYRPFVKVDNFTDNRDLDCENAFKSIDSYRKDPDAYEVQFEE